MEQALDKLRDKTLSFGLAFEIGLLEARVIRAWAEVWRARQLQIEWLLRQHFLSRATIIWHPLTRWRLCRLYRNVPEQERGESCVIEELQEIFIHHPELYDQDELQRESHEKRLELFDLLKEFAALLPDVDQWN